MTTSVAILTLKSHLTYRDRRPNQNEILEEMYEFDIHFAQKFKNYYFGTPYYHILEFDVKTEN